MGAWDYGIFDNDVAGDVKGEVEDRMGEGLSVSEASQRVIDEILSEIPEDDDLEATSGWSALALVQLEHSQLSRHVRDTAVLLLVRPLPGGYPEYFVEPNGPDAQRAVFDATIAQLQAAVVVD